MTAIAIAAPQIESQSLRAGLYGRASSDPKKRGRSIKDQFADGEAECQDRNWIIVDYYEDRDLSASRRAKKVRERYERMVADAEARAIDVIVFAERSRISRTMEVSIRLRDLCERTGVLLCYDGRVFDMSIAADRKEFTRDALASEEEGESMIFRAGRTARLNAKRGAPHGKIPFGYMRKYDEDDGHLIGQFSHPVHAQVVDSLFRRAATRESLNSLLSYYRKYVPDASRAGMRYLLLNRTYLGERKHKGASVQATWPALVEERIFLEVGAILREPDRRTQKDSRAVHILSGIAVCERCVAAGSAQAFVSTSLRRSGSGKPVYRCSDDASHTLVSEPVMDAFVEEALLEWLARPESASIFQTPTNNAEVDKLRNHLAVLKLQLAEAQLAAGEIDPATKMPRLSVLSLASLEAALLPQIAKVQARIHTLTAAGDPILQGLFSLGPEGIEAGWKRLEIEQRRHVIRKTMNVSMRPAPYKGMRSFDSERIQVIFADQPGFKEIHSRKHPHE